MLERLREAADDLAPRRRRRHHAGRLGGGTRRARPESREQAELADPRRRRPRASADRAGRSRHGRLGSPRGLARVPTAGGRSGRRPVRARRGSPAGGGGHPRVPRPPRARPPPGHPPRGGPPHPAPPLPAGAARRVPGHRPDPARPRDPPDGCARRRGRSRHRPPAPTAPGPALRRGRPEAVDLPLQAGRHRDLPAGRRCPGGRADRALGQLPIQRSRHRLGQRSVLRGDLAAARRTAGVRPTPHLPRRAAGPRHGDRARRRRPRRLRGRRDAQVLREREAADVANAVATALSEGWLVGDGDGGLRRCRADDIAVLLPARTSLPMLEAALSELAVPYRAENSSVVYVAPEIRHLLLALRAAADPTDELALVAALRSPLYGCSDVDLYEWRTAGGRWSPFAGPAAEPTAWTTIRWARRSHTSARSPAGSAAPARRNCSTRSSTNDGCSRPLSPARMPATSGGGCGSWSTRRGHGPTPADEGSAGISGGRRSRHKRAGPATRSSPSATTTRCAS